jgi:transposase-like protein
MTGRLPISLKDAIVYFADLDVATEFFRDIRWPNGVECPTCGSKQVSYLSTRRVWKCKIDHPKRQFTVKVGTIFEDSPLGLDKWLPAVWLITSCKNGISSYELAKDLEVTQKSAWFMLHRIRLAMQSQSFEKFSGECEADETFVGGKIRNMHKSARRRAQAKDGENWGKSVVIGLLHRESQEVRAAVAASRKHRRIEPHLESNLSQAVRLYTDQYPAYEYTAERLKIAHEIIDHLSGYVNGRIHTNGFENFWSLRKRSLKVHM